MDITVKIEGNGKKECKEARQLEGDDKLKGETVKASVQ